MLSKALILVGGFGTRLRPLTCTRPKPMFPIANVPLLERTIEHLKRFGVSEVILAVHYQTELIRSHFGRGEKWGITVRYSEEKEPMGTAGAIKFAQEFIQENDKLIVLNSDIVAYIDFRKMEQFHDQKSATATIALKQVHDPSRFGVVELDEQSRIMKFIEKPTPQQTKSKLINAGAYILNASVLDLIPNGQPQSIERDTFPKLAKKANLYGFQYEGLWIDTGNAQDYLQANREVLEYELQTNASISPSAQIDPTVKINAPVIIGEGCVIKSGATIGPHVSLGNRCHVDQHTTITNSIVLPNSRIGENTRITGVIMGEQVRVGSKVKIEGQTILGDYVVVANNLTIVPGVSVCPWKALKEDILKPKTIM